MIRRRRWVDGDTDGDSCRANWGGRAGAVRGRAGGFDGAGWNVWLLRNTDIVFADSWPGVSSFAVRIGHAADIRWGDSRCSGGNRADGGERSGCDGGGACRDTHVVLADSSIRITSSTILVGHAAQGNDGGAGGVGGAVR
jgi:hypothetical protein